MLLTFDPFYIQPNKNIAIQRVINEMQEYKYIQFIQFNYLQVMNINCKQLFVYSYCCPAFLYAYIIACKILNFSATVEVHAFRTLSGQKNLFELRKVFQLQDFKFFDLILHEKDVGGENM